MKLDPETGRLEIFPSLHLHRFMTRTQLFSMESGWEEWSTRQDQVTRYRKILDIPELKALRKTILIVTFALDDGFIHTWDFSSWELTDGYQNRPEGKRTKDMRKWFKEAFDVDLPIGGNWGNVDATYDPHNQSTGIVCNYRELFTSEEDWKNYRQRNKF